MGQHTIVSHDLRIYHFLSVFLLVSPTMLQLILSGQLLIFYNIPLHICSPQMFARADVLCTYIYCIKWVTLCPNLSNKRFIELAHDQLSRAMRVRTLCLSWLCQNFVFWYQYHCDVIVRCCVMWDLQFAFELQSRWEYPTKVWKSLFLLLLFRQL